MGNGETKQVGNAMVTKVVSKTSIAQRDSAGTKIGRRSFQSTTYCVNRLDGRLVDVVGSFEAAEKLAASI